MRTMLSGVIFLLSITGCLAVGSLRFLVIGDMGGIPTHPYHTAVEVGTAKEMAKIASLYQPQFVLEIGDNFYYDGVKNVEDPRFKKTFEDVYTDASLQIPWYLVAGNHDHHGNVSAQIEYSKKSTRWHYPDFYYPLTFNIPGTNLHIDFIMMDTVLLCGNTGHDNEHAQPAPPADPAASTNQWSFVEERLSKSTSEYLFTVGHYPVYSVAEHGPTKCLVTQLLPKLYQHRASGHMSGHDHNLQHLQTTQNGVTLDFILSGAANFIDGSVAHRNSVPSGASKFHWGNILSKGGFVYAEATARNITFTYLEASGHILYNTVVFPRKV